MALQTQEHYDRAEEQRLDQEWSELLNEVRVVLPGISVLFGFLLALPFAQGFGQIARTDKTTYFIAFMCAAIASLLFTAPSIQHRLLWRRQAKEEQLQIATRLMIAGALFLAVAWVSAVFLVVDVLYGVPLSVIVTVLTTSIALLTWYALPLALRLRRRGPWQTDRG